MLLSVAFAAVQLLFSNTKDGCEYLRTNTFPNYSGPIPKVTSYRDMLEVTANDPLSAMFLAKKRCTSLSLDNILNAQNEHKSGKFKMNKAEDFETDVGDSAGLDIKSIIYSGNPDNRIDVVFMGDGYTQNQRDQFFNDISRLVNEMWNGETFKPLLPMFNIWALFVPSQDSGITFMSYRKNTAFGLTRDGNELRGILPNKAGVARQLCRQLGTKCDYPSIIGNDVFYGGLGGEFVISTSSLTTGTTVLRHEMGHNFGTEGEEYDDGFVYSGYNNARSINSIPWSRWANTAIKTEEKLNLLATEHPWSSLDKPYVLNFKTSSDYKYWKVLISLSGVEDTSRVEVSVDDRILTLESKGTLDRQFYYWKFTDPLPNGQHTLTVKQLKKPTLRDPRTGDFMQRTVCSLDIHEYQKNVHEDFYKVGAFPTWDIRGSKSYRPTNDLCIMRNMTSTKFCPICTEGFHLNFLQKIKLIDGLNVTCSGNTGTATLQAIPYGQFSKSSPSDVYFDISWSKDGKVQEALAGKTSASNLASGSYDVSLKFNTPHVRLESKYLTDKRTFKVTC